MNRLKKGCIWLTAGLLALCIFAGCRDVPAAPSMPSMPTAAESSRTETSAAGSESTNGDILLPESFDETSSEEENSSSASSEEDVISAGLFGGASDVLLNYVKAQFGEQALREIAENVRENGYREEVWREITGNSLHALRSLAADEPNRLPNVRLLSMGERGSEKSTVLTFGGDICFADNYVVMQHLRTTPNGLADCIAPQWFAEMQAADIAIMNNEFTISDRGEPMAGKLYTFRAAVDNTALYHALGVDFVTLANNHAFDFGKDAFLDTLDALQTHKIDYAGGGRNAQEAQRPFYYIVDGRKIALVSATRAEKHIMTPEAGVDSPGVFRCYDTARLLEVLAEAKANSDYVVLLVHWGTEHTDVLEQVQKSTSHDYIDAGADLIVGAHAHQLQGIEFYNGKAIFYNLGNFWFDDYRIETGLLRLEWRADGSEEFTFLPGLQANCVTSYEAGTEIGREILAHLASYRAGVSIDENGRVRRGV